MFDHPSEISCEIIHTRAFANIVGLLYLTWHDTKKSSLRDETLEAPIKEIQKAGPDWGNIVMLKQRRSNMET